jgi:uncharacterized protein (DUF2252 family)
MTTRPDPKAFQAAAAPSFIEATARYETWLASQMDLVKDDLALKHEKMAASAFMFLRATFYRWMQLWPLICPDLAAAPRVLAVGDLHTENFGTWRDVEGRLIWGCNDFDEAYELPYALDLVRLAVSGLLGARLSRSLEASQGHHRADAAGGGALQLPS